MQIEQSETAKAEKILRLYEELTEAQKDKKDLVKACNENIKRIKAEMEDVLEDECKEEKSSEVNAAGCSDDVERKNIIKQLSSAGAVSRSELMGLSGGFTYKKLEEKPSVKCGIPADTSADLELKTGEMSKGNE